MLNDRVLRRVLFVGARSAVPVSSICLVVDLDNILASCTDDTTRVEHHAGDGVVIGISVGDGASSEIPDLKFEISGRIARGAGF